MGGLTVKDWLKSPGWRAAVDMVGTLLSACLTGALLCAIAAIVLGHGPLEIIDAIWEGSWGESDAAAATIAKTTPLLLTGLAVALAYQVNLLNIGCEGQLMLGALAAATMAVRGASLPFCVLLPATIVCGALTGALWAWPAILLKHWRGTHEVITTLLLNYMAAYIAEYLVLGPLGDGTAMGRSHEIPVAVMLEPTIRIGTVGISVAPFAAVLLAGVLQVWLSRTFWGFEVTITGSNMTAADTCGIDGRRWQRRIFLLSGALAGLAGALEVLAVHHRFYRAFSPGYGFDGITSAFLVNCVPGMLWLSALLMASLRAADKWLQLALGISPSIILIVQAGLLLVVTCRPAVRFLRRN